MKILVAGQVVPSASETSVRAANTVFFEILRGFAAQEGIEVGYLHVESSAGGERLDDADLGRLRSHGIHVLQPLQISETTPPRGMANKLRNVLAPTPTDYYPILQHRQVAAEAVSSWRPDALIIPWSDDLTALFAHCSVPVKYAYHGNPYPKGMRTQFEVTDSFNTLGNGAGIRSQVKSVLQRAMRNRRLRHIEKFHLDLMGHFDAIGNVAFNDALYYHNHGLNGFYVRNMWFDRYGESALTRRQQAESTQNLIIGNIGRPAATANTLGLRILAEEIVPALRNKLGANKFAVHILGAGTPLPEIKQRLSQYSEIVIRGFVDDIDHEMQQAKVFLVANNGSSYKVGHTRYLHAWSLGCCVVAHADASLSMPEIVNGHNALLGRDSEEIADRICEALENHELRRTIAENGNQTFRQLFTCESVVPGIVQEVKRIYQRKGFSGDTLSAKAA